MSSSKKDTGTKITLPADAFGFYNNELTSKDMKMKEITGKIQRDQDVSILCLFIKDW